MGRWLTPDTPSGSPVRRVLVIPDTYVPSVNGALEELTNDWNWDDFGTETTDDAVGRMSDMVAAYYVSDFPEGAFMRHFTLPLASRIGTDAMIWTQDNAAYNAGYWQWSSVAINRKFSFDIPLLNGAHVEVFIMASKGAGSGIISLKDNGALVATYDLYNASIQRNQLIAGASFDETSDGVRTFEFIVESKNASSSNYQVSISEISVRVTFP